MATESVPNVIASRTAPQGGRMRLAGMLPGAGALYASTIFQAAGRFVIGVLIARLIGADALGIFTLGFVSLQMLVTISVFGLDIGIYHFVSPAHQSRDRATVRSLLWASLIPTLSLAVLVGILYILVIPFYPLAGQDPASSLRALQLFALGVPFQVALGMLSSFAIALGNSSVRVLAERVLATAGQVIVIGMVLILRGGIAAVAVGYVVGIALGALAAGIMVWRILPRTNQRVIWGKWVGELYRYSYTQGFARIAGYVLMNANLFLLGYFSNSFQVGLYAAASRLTLLGLLFLDAFGQMFAASAASQPNREVLKQESQWVTKWIMLTSCPMFVLLAVFAPTWMSLMGSALSEGGNVLTLLAVAQFLSMSTGAIGITLSVRGHPKVSLMNNLVAWGMSAVLTAILASSWGALGAAFAYLVAIVIFLLLEATESRILLGFMPFGRLLLKPLLVLGLLALAAVAANRLYNWTLITLIPLCAVLLLGYVLLLWRVAMPPQDLAMFREIRQNVQRKIPLSR